MSVFHYNANIMFIGKTEIDQWINPCAILAKMDWPLKTAHRFVFVQYYHQILDSILLSTCFLSVSTGYVFLSWNQLIAGLNDLKKELFVDNSGNIHTKTKVSQYK